MLFAVELAAALILGFVFGRVWQIRQHMMSAEHAGDRPRRIESGIATQIPQQPPKDENELVAAFDREMKELVAAVAAKGRHLMQTAQPRR